MKKYIISISAILAFSICCMLGITAYAATDISNAEVTLEKTSYTYTGNEIKPSVTVTVADESDSTVKNTLIKNTDYTVSYSNNINAGTATVTVTGKDGYSGSISKTYKINQRAITSAGVAGCKVKVGTVTSFTITYNSMTLVKGTDYTYTVSDNDYAGETATVTITGKGNYKGTKTLSRVTYPSQVKSLSSTDRTTTSFDLNWSSLSSEKVTGYKIYKCDSNGENLEYYKTVSGATGTVSGYSAGEYAYLKVRAYVTVGDKTYYGDYSSTYKTTTKPKTVVMKSVTKNKAGTSIAVKWNKAGATGYQIQYTTDKNFKNGVKTVTVAKGSTVSKSISISSNKVYYARVRAYRQFKYAGKQRTIYGAWSSKLSTSYSKLYSSYTTNYVNNANRTTNLKLACKAINGTIVYPGETFSFNKVVGQRTAAKGYKEATIFTGSTGTAQSLGGGICQVASTMFNAVLLGNLGIVERHQHSQRVSYCPLGRDAAIYWGSEDFKFKNTTNYPIKIKMTCANGQITTAFYVCYDVSPKKVSLKVTSNNGKFTLKRYVDGKCNYTTVSKY